MPSASDRLIVEQIREGDARAWEDLISRYEGRLLAFVNRRLRDRATSEDVVQETFVGFLNSLPNYDEKRELQTYLFTIASHKLTDHLRRTGRHPLQHISDGPDDLLHQKADDDPAASSVARNQERKDLESQALELLCVKGWANCDVAKFLDISEQQVANFRFAALKKLSERIRDAGLSPDVFPGLHP
jgi:RNA polymerase sigma-70 factor, ECF subfamily